MMNSTWDLFFFDPALASGPVNRSDVRRRRRDCAVPEVMGEEDAKPVSLNALAAGDEREWERAYQPLYDAIYPVLRAKVQSAFGVDWEDLVIQIITREIMPKLQTRDTDSFRQLRTFEDLLRLSKSMADKRGIDLIRKVQRKKEDALPEEWEQGGTEPDSTAEDLESFRYQVNTLKPPKPEMFELHFVHGHTYDEIAEIKGTTVGNVCSHFYRGFKELRKLREGDKA